MDSEVIICLGSNISSGREALAQALDWLKNIVTIIAQSDTYLTVTEGKDICHPYYYNAVIAASTFYSAPTLIQKIKQYEALQGRMPKTNGNSDIVIDIDVVVYDNKIIKSEDYFSTHFKRGIKMLPSKFHNLNLLAH